MIKTRHPQLKKKWILAKGALDINRDLYGCEQTEPDPNRTVGARFKR